MSPALASGYNSKSQRTRVITESWAADELYCLACSSNTIEPHQPNKRVEDYFCPSCDRRIQLKAKRNRMGRKVANSAYEPKMAAIRENRAPDYAFMVFDPQAWRVTALTYVPGHFLVPSAVEARKPLSSNARRSGWVGSNIVLDRIPEAGKIQVVREGRVVPKAQVRRSFQRTEFLQELSSDSRGWLADTLECMESLGLAPGDEFHLHDVYRFEKHLSELHPENNNVRPKIRQQMQVLRDEGLVEFLGRGRYRWR